MVRRVVARASIGGLIALGLLGAAILLGAFPSFGTGVDERMYREATIRWLSGGSWYLPRQLAGPYVASIGDVMYPPVMLWLFVPMALTPPQLWYAIPIGLIAWSLWRMNGGSAAAAILAVSAVRRVAVLVLAHALRAIGLPHARVRPAFPTGGARVVRPNLLPVDGGSGDATGGLEIRRDLDGAHAPIVSHGMAWWTWPILLVLCAWPWTLGFWLFGNPKLWIVAGVFVLVSHGWRWWAVAGITLVVLSLPFGSLWADWFRVVGNARSMEYQYATAVLLVLPVVAWLGHKAAMRGSESATAVLPEIELEPPVSAQSVS